MLFKKLIYAVSITFCLSNSAFSQPKQHVTFLNKNTKQSNVPFSEAVKVGGQLFLSGQIGFSSQTGKLVDGGFEAQARQTLNNIKNTLERYDYRMKDVIKCTVILTDIDKFKALNHIYKQLFAYPYPARTTFAAKSLAMNAQIEIECIAAK